jgi:hypothetical protein
MTQAYLVIDTETLRPGNLGPATANVWLMLDNSAFPVEGWNDFVVVILEAWVSALLRLLRGLSNCELVHFMDGPYVVELGALAAETLHLRAIKNGRDEVAHVDAKAIPLIESLLVGSEGVLAACRAQDCWSADADKLSANLPALRREMMRLKN